jgi:hypothetical protein
LGGAERAPVFTAYFVMPPMPASTLVFAAATGMPSQPQICEGELGEDKSFHLNLRAQNLAFFLQIAEGIDDRSWLHHLRAATIRSGSGTNQRQRTRRRCRERRYTGPA